MSEAYKCDRCGSYFTNKDFGEDWLYQHPIDTEKAFDMVYLGGTHRQKVAIDLCPKCAKEFNDWLNTYKDRIFYVKKVPYPKGIK